jgi:histidinol dehydrogenase
MVTRLETRHPDFEMLFSRYLSNRHESAQHVSGTVSAIIDRIREEGDRALLDYTRTFDLIGYTSDNIAVSAEEITQAYEACSPAVIEALEVAAERIRSYHEKQLPEKTVTYTDEEGVTLGWKWTAISDVGLYVPGGLASYPSSVLMNAIPAKTAGVERLAMVVPTPRGEINPAVLVAAKVAKVDEIYKIGGAQAVAALAYGTETVHPVMKIVGPGNAYVAEAKRQVFGKVGIDMIAGPSEILVVADMQNPPEWIAADLLSQAEHDPLAQSILITNDSAYADLVDIAVSQQLEMLSRRSIAAESWMNYGAIIVVQDWAEAIALIDRIAPEHLELAVENPEALAMKIRNAGAIFLGRYTPEAIGDYLAGPSHVLPTSGTAKFSSGLSVLDFMKRTSLIGCSREALLGIGPHGETLAQTEGLHAHGRSITLRIQPRQGQS